LTSRLDCLRLEGVYLGDSTRCDTASCPPAKAAK